DRLVAHLPRAALPHRRPERLPARRHRLVDRPARRALVRETPLLATARRRRAPRPPPMPAVDVLVIGGGIPAGGGARGAALRGLAVARVGQAAGASGPSSRSSNLVHGGLRSLETGQFGLGREALAERRLLLAPAPALVEPQPFLLPDDPRGRP